MKATLRRSLLTAALALASLPAFAGPGDSPFSQTVFFGDSLTDAGYFRPLLGPNGAVIGQFTNNPGYVWSQYLADYYGSNAAPAWLSNTTANPTLSTGNNWAAGGARVNTPVVGGLGYIPSLTAQYARYLSSGHSVDPNALYTVWGGANDIFSITNPANAPATIGAAVTAQVGLVGALTQAGARYVLVPTLPDLGLTPASRAGGAVAMAQGTALATSYNNALFGGLASANLHVIPMDTFHFLQEVVANPSAYGISNVTTPACSPAFMGGNSLFCSPATTAPGGASYLFADGVHPTTAAHKALADLAMAMIEGPRQIAVLPHSAAVTGRSRAQMLGAAIEGFGKGEDGRRWWADVRGNQQRYDGSAGFDGIGPSASFGIGWNSGNLSYGGFANYARQNIDFGERRGEFKQTDMGLGAFVGWQGEALWANAQVGWSKLSFDVDRQVNLGPATRVHTGSPDGDDLSVGGNLGWNFGHGALKHGPVVSVLLQKISVDGYAESDPALSTSLAFAKQDVDSLTGSIGWQASYAINDHVQPYAKLAWEREFDDQPEQAFARSQSIAGSLDYAVPGLGFDEAYGTAVIGVRSKLMGLDANVGASLTVAQKGGNDASFFLSLGKGF